MNATDVLAKITQINPNDSGDEIDNDFDDDGVDFELNLSVDLESDFNSDSDNEDDDENEEQPVNSMDDAINTVADRYLDALTPNDIAQDQAVQLEQEQEGQPKIDKTSKNKIEWQHLKEGNETGYRIRFRENARVTSYANSRINESAISAFRLLLNDSILTQIVESTNAEAILHQSLFRVTQLDILAFIGVQFVRGIYLRGVAVRDLWSEKFCVSIIKKIMSRNKFVKIMKFLRFDDKVTTKDERLKTDSFAMIREVWDKFIQNCQNCYIPSEHLTIDEQLLNTKTRCPFEQ